MKRDQDNRQREKELPSLLREVERLQQAESKAAAKAERAAARDALKLERMKQKELEMQEKSMMRAEKERLRLAEKEEKLKMVARMREEAALRRKDELEKRRAEREKEKEVRCDVLCCDVYTPSQTPFVCQQFSTRHFFSFVLLPALTSALASIPAPTFPLTVTTHIDWPKRSHRHRLQPFN
jgi:hypothetical protein